MGFLDFFRPKWRHSDFDTRAQAVRDLSDDELSALAEVAKSDPDVRVRHIARASDGKAGAGAALERVTDPAQLAIIARDGRIKAVRQAAQARLPRVETSISHDDEEAAAAARPGPVAPAMNQAEAKKLRQR